MAVVAVITAVKLEQNCDDFALLIFLEDKESSEEESECLRESDIFKRRAMEEQYEILVFTSLTHLYMKINSGNMFV